MLEVNGGENHQTAAADPLSPAGRTKRVARESRGRDAARRGRAIRDHERAALIESLSAIREQLLQVGEGWRPWIEGRDADRDASARNLLQYLALRGHDLRELQDPLVALGLSSLGGSQGHVQASVDAVLDALRALAGHPSASPSPSFAADGLRSQPGGPGAQNGGSARTGAARAPDADHGDDAHRGGARPGLRPRDADRGDELHQDQLRARQRSRMARDAREPSSGRGRDPATCARGRRPAGPEAPHRTARTTADPRPQRRLSAARLGDRLRLTRVTGETLSGAEEPASARIRCSLGEAFTVTRPGHRVWLDDGKLGGVVESVDQGSIELLITSAGRRVPSCEPARESTCPTPCSRSTCSGHIAGMRWSSLPSAPTSSGFRSSAARARCSGSAHTSTSTPGRRSG